MYQALYRKWRPQVFSDVIGQNHITSTLKNQVAEGKTAHAYLFTGTRGTGKTTCAKIFAKAVNCQHPVNGDPCNECDACRGINDGSILDVVEIDAASNNGVDNIRDIRDEVVYTPAQVKKRVYIIDEVHMLSSGAFNALLKTLEEPPSHVLFILATTEVQKLPATIISRCQRYDFKRINASDIAERLMLICRSEGIDITSDAASLIGRLADGAMRDALSILDQCRGLGQVNTESVSKAVGLLNTKYLFEISTAVKNNNISAALCLLDKLYKDAKDVSLLCSELISHYRNMLIVKTVKDFGSILTCGKDEAAALEQSASLYTVENIIYCISTLEETLNRLTRYSLNKRIEMEICFMQLCNPRLSALPEAIAARVSELEAKLASLQLGGQEIAAGIELVKVKKETKKAEAPEPVKEKAPESKTPEPTEKCQPAPFWSEVKSFARDGGNMAFASHLDSVTAEICGSELIIFTKDSFTESLIKKSQNIEMLKKYIAAASGKDYDIIIKPCTNGDLTQSNAGIEDILSQSSELQDIIEITD